MPYTSGKLKGQLTGAEIRKLIRGHNKLVSIKIPPKTDRDGLIKLIEDNGYKLDHKKQAILDSTKSRPRRPKVTLEEAKKLTKPKEKTALQKQKAKEKKEEKEIQKKKEVRQIKKEAVKKEKQLQKKKDIKDKILSTNNNRKKKMPTISTQTETPKKKQVLKLPSQKPKKVTIDKSKKPPMNTKKIEPKKVEKPKRKLKGRLTAVRDKTTEEIEKLYPQFYGEDRKLTMQTRGYISKVLSVYHKIKSIGSAEQKEKAKKVYNNFRDYRGDDKGQFHSYQMEFEEILKESPKKKENLKLPSQKPKNVTIDKSKKPPMNTKKIEPKKKEDEFKLDPNNDNSKATQLAWFEYKKLLDANKTKLEDMKINKKHGTKTYKNQYEWFRFIYQPSLQTGKGWLKKLKAVLDGKPEKKVEPKKEDTKEKKRLELVYSKKIKSIRDQISSTKQRKKIDELDQQVKNYKGDDRKFYLDIVAKMEDVLTKDKTDFNEKDQKLLDILQGYETKMEEDKKVRNNIYKQSINILGDVKQDKKLRVAILMRLGNIWEKWSKGSPISQYFTDGLGLRGKKKQIGKILIPTEKRGWGLPEDLDKYDAFIKK